MTASHLSRDAASLGLVVVTAMLGLALLTYDPADPVPLWMPPLDQLYQPDRLVEPPNAVPANACGRVGVVVADFLLATIGIASYVLVGLLAGYTYRRVRRQPTEAPWVRAAGAAAILLGTSTLAAILLPHWSPGPIVGAGGKLGALLAVWLTQFVATTGAAIMAASTCAAGILLWTDEGTVEAARKAARFLHTGLLLPAVRLVRGLLPARANDAASVSLQEVDEDEVAEATDDEDEWESYEETEDTAEDEDVATEEAPEETEPAPRPVRIKRRRRKTARPADERQAVMSQLDQASLVHADGDYTLPSLDLLLEPEESSFEAQAKEVRQKAKILEKTFANFGFHVRVVEIETGPVIAQYEVELEAGLRLSKITGLADDLAIALRVPSVRIVAPIPGKNTIGIEVPNATRQIVRLREVMEETSSKFPRMKIPLFLGKDVAGNPLVVDLATMPHLLIAGRTGTGKSVCLNSIITSMLMTRRPDEVRLLLIDPKMVELSGYGRLPHLMHPVVTDMRKAEAILAWAVEKMEERYKLLAKTGVRHISSYNELGREELVRRLQPADKAEEEAIPDRLPFIVIVADEMADLMMTAGKDVEQHIIRLAQKSRAVGIHLVLATQKPTVDVITGLIKSNLPARISFQVASRTDSRVVLDEMGAEKLLGYGDMLFLWPGTSTLIRGQGTYLSDEEIQRVVDSVATGEPQFVEELVALKVKDDEETAPSGALRKRDPLYEQAVDIVVREGRGSVSLLQRCLGIGYGRAARLIDFMAEDGIVGEYAGSQAREVLISIADWERMQAEEDTSAEAPSPPPAAARKEATKASVASKRSPTVLAAPVAADEETWEEEPSRSEADETDEPRAAEDEWDTSDEDWDEGDDAWDESEDAWDESEETDAEDEDDAYDAEEAYDEEEAWDEEDGSWDEADGEWEEDEWEEDEDGAETWDDAGAVDADGGEDDSPLAESA